MKLKIFSYPDKVLTQLAKPISRVEKKHRSLADDMLETMYDAPGIGLAANQVGILERIIVVDTEYEIKDDESETLETQIIYNKKPIVLINPEIIKREGQIKFEEGCLSVPDYTVEVDRTEKITVKYLDLDGLEHTFSIDGLQAVCIQHEIDHLDGKLFIDRLSLLKRQIAQKKVLKYKANLKDEEDNE